MFALKNRQDGFRFLLPNELIPEEINEKYTKILTDNHSFITKPIDFLNESMQSIDVFGFTGATVTQQQPAEGSALYSNNNNHINYNPNNNFLHGMSDFNYRAMTNPIALVDKTLNITFRHTLGFVNYFLLFESFFYLYSRDMSYDKLPHQFNIDIFNENGAIYSKVVLMEPMIDSMEMLSFNYTQPIAQSQTFKVIWKYSNFDYQFIEYDANTDFIETRDI